MLTRTGQTVQNCKQSILLRKISCDNRVVLSTQTIINVAYCVPCILIILRICTKSRTIYIIAYLCILIFYQLLRLLASLMLIELQTRVECIYSSIQRLSLDKETLK
jgi:hypothetical protein